MANLDSTTKQCTKCKREFPATDEYFHHRKSNKDGLNSKCKICNKLAAREYYYNHTELARAANADWRKKHPDKMREYQQSYVERNPEKVRQSQRKYSANNRERERKRGAKYRAENLEKKRESAREWSRRNREYNRLDRRKRRSKVGGIHTQADVDLQLKSQKGLCWWCGEPITGNYHVDHRIPLARGGSNDARNICITHPECNQSKNDKMPWEWNGRLL